jgi:uncharacterized protein
MYTLQKSLTQKLSARSFEGIKYTTHWALKKCPSKSNQLKSSLNTTHKGDTMTLQIHTQLTLTPTYNTDDQKSSKAEFQYSLTFDGKSFSMKDTLRSFSMLRTTFTDQMKTAMKAGDKDRLAAIRLIMAALKDKDIDARASGNMDGISDEQICQMLQSMVKQRRDSIKMYQDGNRQDLADKEQSEIDIIMTFLPQQMDEADIQGAIAEVIASTGATSAKDMGAVMAALKNQYAGKMDFGKASQLVKQALS